MLINIELKKSNYLKVKELTSFFQKFVVNYAVRKI